MKKINVLITCILLVFFVNCSKSDPDPMESGNPNSNPKISITINGVSDYENLGNSADIFVNYSTTGNSSTIKELRLYISTASDLTENDLLQIPVSNYHIMPVGTSLKTVLDPTLNDTDGNPITEEKEYTISILGLLNDEASAPLLSNALSLTLKNEIVVTTPLLKGAFKAGEDIAITSNGTLYINEGFQGNKLYKITPNGESSIFSSAMNGPVGIALDKDENIYTSNFNSTVIKKITPQGVVSDFVSDSKLVGGGGLVFDNDGNLFNAFYASSTIYKINQGTVENSATSNLFSGPVGVAYDKERGKLFVASFDSGKIFFVADDETVMEVADTDLNIGHLSYANDHFYATGWNQHKVYKISLDGEIIAKIGSGNQQEKDGASQEAAFNQPNGIEATADGRYVYVSQGGGNLRKIVMPREN